MSFGKRITTAATAAPAVRSTRPRRMRWHEQLIGERGERQPRRLLDAAGGLRGGHPRLPEDRRRQGRGLQAVLRRVRRPGAGGRGRPQGRRRGAVARARRRQARRGQARSRRTGTRTKYDGFVTNSVVVLAIRKGNPKNIKTWDDLTKDGVEVITPNPFTSGGAKWNIMAAYGAQLEAGQVRAGGQAVPQGPVRQRARPGQERPRGAADVRRRQGRRAARLRERGDHRPAEGPGRSTTSIPDETILIQNPIAVTIGSSDKAAKFVDFTRSRRGAEDLRREGLPLGEQGPRGQDQVPDAARTCSRSTKFGGWGKVNEEFFDPEDSVTASINKDQGVPTEK